MQRQRTIWTCDGSVCGGVTETTDAGVLPEGWVSLNVAYTLNPLSVGADPDDEADFTQQVVFCSLPCLAAWSEGWAESITDAGLNAVAPASNS